MPNLVEEQFPNVSVQRFLPPVDPYIAAAGYNMLVQVAFTRIARYLNDTWIAQLAPVNFNMRQFLTTVQGAQTSFASPFLKSVQNGTLNTSQLVITCQLSVSAVKSGSAGEIAVEVSAEFSGCYFSGGMPPYVPPKMTKLGDFGPLVLQLDAPISAELDAAHAIATITANFADANVSFDQSASSSDVSWLIPTDAGKSIVASIGQTVASIGSVQLLPPVSPFGDLSGSNVFETFQVDAFPTQNPAFAAAGLSIGFRLRNAAVPSPSEVKSIAGFDDYGTIMDEGTVARVLESRWPQGYLKHFDYSGLAVVDLKDGKGPQDVEIFGSLDLTSLDSVTIEPGQSASADDDYIDLSGACTVTIDAVKSLSDGRERVVQKDNSFTSNWSFAAGVSPHPPTPMTPPPASEKAFIDFASEKAVKYLARPFRGVVQTVNTGSLDGVAGFMYSTGQFEF